MGIGIKAVNEPWGIVNELWIIGEHEEADRARVG